MVELRPLTGSLSPPSKWQSVRFSSDGSETDSVLRLEFQPDRSLVVRSAETTIHVREPPKVDVASSAASDSKAVVQVEGNASAPSVVDVPEGHDGANMQTSKMEITQKTVKGRFRRVLREEDSVDVQDTSNEKDRILDTPAMETRYIDPQEIHGNLSEGTASAAPTAATDAEPTQSASGGTSVLEVPNLSEIEVIHETDQQPDMGRRQSDDVASLGLSISQEKPDVKEDSAVLEKPETPSTGQPEEFFSAPTHPSSRKRKQAITYTSSTRNSKKKQKMETPSREKLDSAETNSDDDDDGDSTIIPAPSLPSKNAKGTPKSRLNKTTAGMSSTVKKTQQPQERKKTRLSGSSAESVRKYDGPPPRIVFSNSTIPAQTKYMNFLRKQNVKTVEVVGKSSTDMVCVGEGELKRTSKLTLGVLFGKTIVTDKWVLDSHQAGHLVDPTPYLPTDPERETQWNFNLHEAVERGKREVRIFKGWTVHFTPSFIHREPNELLSELTSLVRAAGGKVVTNRSFPKQSSPDTDEGASALIIATTRAEDDDTESLAKSGWSLYSRDIIPLSILRGKVENDSEEFKIQVGSGTGAATGTGGVKRGKKGR
ncbi:MAG: hypothetical protein M1816_001783 [Peltula sp. TS41687]|nr:MAG: hypothetical protein M1816_001783 [Peltula sp. TS41687]